MSKLLYIMWGDRMKGIFKKLGFRKMDEMERYIAFKAQRNAYVFLIAALFIWSMYESLKVFVYHTRLNLFPCMLLAAAALIQNFSQLAMARSAVKGDEDSHETGPLLKIIILTCVVTGVIVTIGAAFILMSVRI